MANRLESLEAEALQLTASERAAFAQVLLASLDEDAGLRKRGPPKPSAELPTLKAARCRSFQLLTHLRRYGLH